MVGVLPESPAESFKVPEGIGTSPEGNIPAMNLEEVDEFLKANKIPTNKQSVNSNSETAEHSVVSSVPENVSREKIFLLLQLAKEACNSGVTRVHILNGSLDGTIPCEIFSDLGSGTMIYYNNYGGIRAMTRDDIPGVLNVMKPFHFCRDSASTHKGRSFGRVPALHCLRTGWSHSRLCIPYSIR